jgi:hypothetical protein
MWPYLQKMFGGSGAGTTTTTGGTGTTTTGVGNVGTGSTAAGGTGTGKVDTTPAPGTTTNPYEAQIAKDYQMIFGHAPDAEGLKYWESQMAANPNKTNEQLIQDLISGAQGADKTAAQKYLESLKVLAATSGGGGNTSNVTPWVAPDKAATDAAGKVQQIQNARATATQGQGINDQTAANEVAAADWLVKNGFVPASVKSNADPTNLASARANPEIENALKGAAALGIPGFPTYYQGGRVGYSTGGKIPEMDKAFNDAKKYVDNHTKGLLKVHDDAIAHALHIAKGKL